MPVEGAGAAAVSGRDAVVVAVDGSPASVEALHVAHRMSALLDRRLVAVIATDQREPWDWTYPYQGWDPRLDAARHLRGIVDRELGGAARAVEITSLEGRAVDAITQFSLHAALLVLGNRGRGPVLSALLGSVTAGCAARARCPVLVVPRALDREGEQDPGVEVGVEIERPVMDTRVMDRGGRP